MTDVEVPYSTDWLPTPLAGIAAVEDSLRCQVCKDFYKTPMITSCSHTFCSLCIRRALSNDGKCPLCRAGEQELKLRSNWAMEETVEAFTKARSATLEVARNHRTVSKRKESYEEHDSREAAPSTKRLRTSARLSKSRAEAPPAATPAKEFEDDEVLEVPDSDANGEDEDYTPENNDGLVACPVCATRMKEWQVYNHLESCTGPPSPPKTNGELIAQRRQAPKAADRLPAISYSMLKEQALRKKLAELGISNAGPRPLLEKRHKEWITLWNANCDAANPKKRTQLLHDLDVWEKTQGGRAPTTGRGVREAALIKDKDFDGHAWAARHDESFRELIENARRSRKKTTEPVEDNEVQPEESARDHPSAPDPPTLKVGDASQHAQIVVPGVTEHSDGISEPTIGKIAGTGSTEAS